MNNNNIKKRPVFSEFQINIINTFSMIVTYIIIGLILNIDYEYFGTASKAIIISLIVLGLFGLVTELRKLNKLYGIRGLAEFTIGSFMFCCFLFMKMFTNANGYNDFVQFLYQLILCLLLMIVIFSICKGVIKMFWSVVISYNRKFKGKRKGILFSRIMFVITQCVGIGLLFLLFYNLFFIII